MQRSGGRKSWRIGVLSDSAAGKEKAPASDYCLQEPGLSKTA